MFDMPDLIRMAQDLARHSSARQAEIARNVANADTPGYRARDIVPFSQVVAGRAEMPVTVTRAGHLRAMGQEPLATTVLDQNSEPSPNGNTVSIEQEMLKASEVAQSHGLALAVYKTSLDMMRTAIGRGR